ncbi:MAG: hypothetical protein WA001_02475 [Patescibacteria group bacterium]
MQIEVANQRILLLKDQMTMQEAKDKAWDKKRMAFDALSKVTSLLSKPKEQDFALTYSEHRYEPFWHVVTKARYEYTRTTQYTVPVSGSEVKTVTVNDKTHDVLGGRIHLPVLEYCLQEDLDENIIDGITGKHAPELRRYMSMTPFEVRGQLKDEVSPDAILLPPQARVSAIMRDSLAKMIKGIQADTILAEQIEVTHIDLYYRPVYAFKFSWITKQKEAILEVDGLTGECRPGNRVFTEYLGKVFDQDFLFDIGGDMISTFVPGGNIAMKVAKHYIDVRKK